MRSQLYVTELDGEGGAPQRHVPAIYCDDGRLTEFRHLLIGPSHLQSFVGGCWNKNPTGPTASRGGQLYGILKDIDENPLSQRWTPACWPLCEICFLSQSIRPEVGQQS